MAASCFCLTARCAVSVPDQHSLPGRVDNPETELEPEPHPVLNPRLNEVEWFTRLHPAAQVHVGLFEHGAAHGDGVYYDCKGSVHCGAWVTNRRVGSFQVCAKGSGPLPSGWPRGVSPSLYSPHHNLRRARRSLTRQAAALTTCTTRSGSGRAASA